MIKLTKLIIIGILILTFSTFAFANSAPVYWQAYPSSDVMAVDNNSSIEVTDENLTFDLTGDNDSPHSIAGKVTAAYEMVNPSNESKSVQMAFPFVESIYDFSSDDIAITADNNKLPYDVYIGDEASGRRGYSNEDKKFEFDFGQIVKSITNDVYQAKNFKKDEKGRLYSISVKPVDGQRINFAVSFNFDHEKTKIMTKNFNRFERDDEKVRLASWCSESEVLELYVLGNDIDLNISAFTDGELLNETDLCEYEMSKSEVDVKSYLSDYISSYLKEYGTSYDINELISDDKLYNIYAKSLDRCIENNLGICCEDDINSKIGSHRIMSLVYTVEFPANSKKEVSVSYKTSGSMDKKETKEPKYTFDYILNPAKNWSDFKNLNIRIITPDEAPYVVESSIQLTGEGNNVYTATLAELPEDDFSFTLYSKEEITFSDKAEGFVNRNRFQFILVGIGLIVFTVVTAGIVFLKKRLL